MGENPRAEARGPGKGLPGQVTRKGVRPGCVLSPSGRQTHSPSPSSRAARDVPTDRGLITAKTKIFLNPLQLSFNNISIFIYSLMNSFNKCLISVYYRPVAVRG